MNSTPKKVILRYKKEDLEAMEKTPSGLLYIDTSHDPGQYCCTTAYIEGSNAELEKDGFFKDDKLLVQYLVAWDEVGKKNQFFIEADNGDILRWCNWVQVFGKQNKDGSFTPARPYVFCELPEKEEVKSTLWTPQQNQKTDTHGYFTTIKYIHPLDSEESGLNIGDRILCQKNTDAKKNVFGEELIRVELQRIEAVCPI